MKFASWLKLFESDTDYRMSHHAPSKEFGAPMHNLTINNNLIFANDIYAPDSSKKYFIEPQYGTWIFDLIKRVRNKPNALVTIYRSVPDINYEINKKIKYMVNLINYTDKFRFPPIKDRQAHEIFSGFDYDKDKFIKHLQDEIDVAEKTKKKPLKINPGDWVSPSKEYAKREGTMDDRKHKIIQKTVPAKHLYCDGNGILEWGYDPS